MRKLTSKQEAFAAELARGKSAMEAYCFAYDAILSTESAVKRLR